MNILQQGDRLLGESCVVDVAERNRLILVRNELAGERIVSDVASNQQRDDSPDCDGHE